MMLKLVEACGGWSPVCGVLGGPPSKVEGVWIRMDRDGLSNLVKQVLQHESVCKRELGVAVVILYVGCSGVSCFVYTAR